jgi:hypothetical protein
MGRRLFADCGITDSTDFDIWVALLGGLVNQQLANDPGGTRWSKLLDRAIDVWADGIGLPPEPPAPRRPRTHPKGPRRRTPAPRSTL